MANLSDFKSAAALKVKDEGSTLTEVSESINFTGAGVTATNTNGAVTVNIPNTGSALTVKDEGSNLTTAATSLDFTGTGVTASNTGGAVTINIPSGGSSLTVKDEGSNLTTTATSLDFVGAGVTATNTGSAVTVTVSGGSGGNITTTDIKTANYTANSDERVLCDTSGGAFSITLPTTGKIQIVDVVGNTPLTGFGTNNLTLTPTAGKTIMGGASLVLDIGGIAESFMLVGTDWRTIDDTGGGGSSSVNDTLITYLINLNL